MGAPIRPQMPSQTNPNPNNNATQQFEIYTMPAYSLSPLPCNNLYLRSGRVVEPMIIEDVPSSMTDEGMNP